MAKFSRYFGRVGAMVTQTVIGTTMAWMPASAAERPRPVSDVLNVGETFVEGFPQKYEPTTQVRIVD